MRSRMLPKYYLSQEIFEREQKKIFRRVWLFAGLKMMVARHNAFITRKVAGIPIVIQNFHGELHAFENVCLHRNALIQSEPAGVRPLVCGYHAWRYNVSGGVENIPDGDTLYGFSEEERSAMKLREFSLKVVGNVMFVNVADEPMPFEEQFSAEFIDLLESSADSYDTEVMVTTWHGKFNWKLAYENLRDPNHPRFVHSGSLAKLVSFAPEVHEAQAGEACEPIVDTTRAGLRREMHRFSSAGADAPMPNIKAFSWRKKVERWRDQDVYYNWLAFPNFHIASAGGYAFGLENHIPVAPDRTDLELYWVTAKKKSAYDTSTQVLLGQMHGSKRVVGEDIAIMEQVQAALHNDAPLANQGAYEFMNRLVDRWYVTLMESDHEI